MDRIEAPLWVSGAKGWKGELQGVSWASTLESWQKNDSATHGTALPKSGAQGTAPLRKEVRLTLPKALALANLKRAERGLKAISMDALASEIGVAATTSTRLARTDDKDASSLPLHLAGILTVLEGGIGDLLEVVEQT
jgi:hypothetical protein